MSWNFPLDLRSTHRLARRTDASAFHSQSEKQLKPENDLWKSSRSAKAHGGIGWGARVGRAVVVVVVVGGTVVVGGSVVHPFMH